MGKWGIEWTVGSENRHAGDICIHHDEKPDPRAGESVDGAIQFLHVQEKTCKEEGERNVY